MNLYDIFLAQDRWLYLWRGLEITLLLTVFSVILGLLLGITIALMRQSTWRPLRNLPSRRLQQLRPLALFARSYTTVIQGTPVLVQLLIMYYVVFGSYTWMPKLWVATIAFGINSGAYVAEIIRGGIEAIDKGQTEAATALGMRNWQTMRYILLPQALRRSLPSLLSECIALLKETSVVGWIGMNDLMRGADNIRFQTATAFESLVAAGLIYLCLTSLFTAIMNRVEKRLHAHD